MGRSGDVLFAIDRIDRVIHEPARFVLMACLSVVDEADFVYLVSQTGLSAGNAGAHLKKLSDAGYISITKAFVGSRPQTMFAATREGRQALRAYHETMVMLLNSLGGPTPGERGQRDDPAISGFREIRVTS
jgi:predicted ArsR family transcriptional regulator